jgi:hypothetical protein
MWAPVALPLWPWWIQPHGLSLKLTFFNCLQLPSAGVPCSWHLYLLGPPLQLQLLSHNFIHNPLRHCFQGPWLFHTLPNLLNCLLESRQKLRFSYLHIVHTSNTSTMGTMHSFATRASSCWAPVDHGWLSSECLDHWTQGKKTWGRNSHDCPVP